MPHRLRHWAVLIVIACVIITADQLTKNWVLDNMLLGETLEPIPALAPYFQFTYSHNTGAAFGMLPMAGELFLVLALGIVVVLLFYYPRTPDDV